MSELSYEKVDVLSVSLDGFEGPIDLLLSLARDHKIDLNFRNNLPRNVTLLSFLPDH